MEIKIKVAQGSITIIDSERIILKNGLLIKKEFLLKDLVKITTTEPNPKKNGSIHFIFTTGNFTLMYSTFNKKKVDKFVEQMNNDIIANNNISNDIEFKYGTFINTEYQGGHPLLPDIQKIRVDVTNKKIVLQNNIEIYFSDINSINYDTLEQLEKRVTVTRLLTIGIFALAFKKKKKNIQKYLTVEFTDDTNITQIVAFGGVDANYLYSSMYDAYHQYKKNNKKLENVTSDYDELKKLKELLELNIITQEEFDFKKKQILNLLD